MVGHNLLFGLPCRSETWRKACCSLGIWREYTGAVSRLEYYGWVSDAANHVKIQIRQAANFINLEI